MRKVLIRGGFSPAIEDFTPEYILARNLIGSNTGNAVYLNSIFRLFRANGIAPEIDNYRAERNQFNSEEIAQINEEYDAYIVPLADAFRDSFRKELRNLTKFFKKLSIPCVVVGVGRRAGYEPNFSLGNSYDEEVKEFINAALDKSSIVGLRGELTGQYLKHLGFHEDRDFMAIGCPSMFTLGANLCQRPLNITDDLKLSVSFNGSISDEQTRFLQSLIFKYPGSQYVPQDIFDLKLAYLGEPISRNLPDSYPVTLEHPLYRENQVRMFLQPEAWMDNLAKFDLAIGVRLHGNVVAVLAGTPAVFLPNAARMRELCEYHCFPNVPISQVTSKTTLQDVLDKVDLRSHLKVHANRYERYQEFLKKNGLPFECPETRQEGIKRLEIGGIVDISRKELISRWSAYNKDSITYKVEQEKARTAIQKNRVERLKEDNKKLRKQLNRKAVRFALSVANRLR